ncbi:hypothetical protein [Pseudovibrio sp. Ad37]|uniref:hypothetical protein n=1 Tax=Pseudovibrio sp. Ad37 TaxID=989422 RepID=UPI0007B2EA8A|nr:hypothetical protein [Pseudovibrio sp. Ad37]KZL26272.1 hypothetical protein PsAD37_01951 [Pseudovibrio sp. Ad37]
MRTLNNMRTVGLALVMSFITFTPLKAESLAENANRGLAVWECAAFAQLAGLKESEELFTAGYENLKPAYDLKSKGLLTEDDEASLHMIVKLAFGGPSPDFMLGVLWDRTHHIAGQSVTGENWSELNSSQRELRQEAKATSLFYALNCEQLLTN